jgi:two-component system, NarL family, nitrate/nitrite response regulator NarL
MRLLICTNEPILAKGLECVLENSGFQLRFVTERRRELLSAIASSMPDVVLFDCQREQNFCTLVELRKAFPSCNVVLWARELSVEVSYQAMRLGIRGIVRTTEGAELLIECLRCVARGDCWFDHQARSQFFDARLVNLTPREMELVILVSQGLKNKEVATTLSISEATVRVYLSALFRKLALKDRYELAIYGIKNVLAGVLSNEHGAARQYLNDPSSRRFLVERKTETVAPALKTNKPSALTPRAS